MSGTEEAIASNEEAIASYYSTCSETDRAEQTAWGRFALEQLGPEPD